MIKINKLKFEIQYEERLEDDNQGITDFEKCIIYIKRGMSKENEKITVNHEIVHAFLYANGLYYNDTYNEEQVCELIATHGEEIMKLCKKAQRELEEY